MCGSVFLQGDKGEKNPEEGSEEHGVGLSHVEAELLVGVPSENTQQTVFSKMPGQD